MLNDGVNFFITLGIGNNQLQPVNWAIKNLKNANFSRVNLSGCNFTGVNLKELNLEDASLQGLKLSENIVIPIYNESNCTPLFDRWANSDDEEIKELFQGLIDAGFKFTKGVDINRLQSFSWASKNIKNANFHTLDLTGFNFSGADLSQANLTGANLTNTNFKGANLKRASICGVFLSGRSLPLNDPGHVQLSYNQPHKDLQQSYQSNSDPQVKRLVKQILKGLGYPLQSKNNS